MNIKTRNKVRALTGRLIMCVAVAIASLTMSYSGLAQGKGQKKSRLLTFEDSSRLRGDNTRGRSAGVLFQVQEPDRHDNLDLRCESLLQLHQGRMAEEADQAWGRR